MGDRNVFFLQQVIYVYMYIYIPKVSGEGVPNIKDHTYRNPSLKIMCTPHQQWGMFICTPHQQGK